MNHEIIVSTRALILHVYTDRRHSTCVVSCTGYVCYTKDVCNFSREVGNTSQSCRAQGRHLRWRSTDPQGVM